jgi:zinc transport system substrate-binding protein
VGGDLVDVANLTPAGSEPHDLELTSRQVDRLQDAALVLYLGQGFQPAVEEIAEDRDGPSVDLLASLPLVREAEAHDDDGEDGPLDPHFWLDPTLMSVAVDEIEQALAEVAPEHAATFAANADEYRARLADLDAEFQSALANCARRVFVTSHAAFSYLARRYDLEQRPIAGLSPESEPAPERLDELADLIAVEGVTTVFYEALVDPDVAETLAREAGVETAVLNPLEGLTDEDVEAGRDYIAVMRDNLAALAAALGCA